MTTRRLNDRALTVRLMDVSSANNVYVVSPYRGFVVRAYSVIMGPLSGADAVLTLRIGGVAMTNGTITITQSGSAAGDVDTCQPSALNYVAEGVAIEVLSDGGGFGAADAMITLVIREE